MHSLHCASFQLTAFAECDRHSCGRGHACPCRSVCRSVMFCVALSTTILCVCASVPECVVNFIHFHVGVCDGLRPRPTAATDPVRRGYELDLRPQRLRRGSQVLKLERIPFEILLLLLEHRDEIVTRDQIASRVWGQGVFLDTDNSIRGAIRKLRQVLKDDAETPRFIQTVTGQGYRFIGLVVTPKQASAASEPAASVVPTSNRNFVSESDGWLQARKTTCSGALRGSHGGEGDACWKHSWTWKSEGIQLAFCWNSGFALSRVPSGGLGLATSIEPAHTFQGQDSPRCLAVQDPESRSRPGVLQ